MSALGATSEARAPRREPRDGFAALRKRGELYVCCRACTDSRLVLANFVHQSSMHRPKNTLDSISTQTLAHLSPLLPLPLRQCPHWATTRRRTRRTSRRPRAWAWCSLTPRPTPTKHRSSSAAPSKAGLDNIVDYLQSPLSSLLSSPLSPLSSLLSPLSSLHSLLSLLFLLSPLKNYRQYTG